jgi:predicted metal-dependent enzyme (double-stranded beta helix superfamily)
VKRFENFIAEMTRVVEEEAAEPQLLARAKPLLSDLIEHDDWLAPEHAVPGADTYRQYLLYRDPQSRFSVVSFVWGPGQVTPVHNHTVWGLVGVMRGSERCHEYSLDDRGHAVDAGCEHILDTGEIEAVSPSVGDVHTVANALADRPSISIHVYGADIGRVKRHWYDAKTGEPREFVSGYSNA